MQTIWKYELDITDKQTISVPKGGKFLSAQMQGAQLCIWAQVDPKAEKIPRDIAIVGTGNAVWCHDYEYLSTFQMHGGALIFHIFTR